MILYPSVYKEQTAQCPDPEMFTTTYPPFDSLSPWNSLNSFSGSLSHYRQQQQYSGLHLAAPNTTQQYKASHLQPRSFSSYDVDAHGFTGPPLYQGDIDTTGESSLDHRCAGYLSPMSSTTSLSGADSIKFQNPLTPEEAKDLQPFFIPSHGELYGEQSYIGYLQQPPVDIAFTTSPLYSSSPYMMKDFELSPKSTPLLEYLDEAAPNHNRIDSAQSLEPLNVPHDLKLEYPDTIDQDIVASDNDEPIAQDEPCHEPDARPAHTSGEPPPAPLHSSRRTRRHASSTATATHSRAVPDSSAHIRKSASSRVKSKSMAARKRRISSLLHATTTTATTVTSSSSKPRIRSFPCPFAAFGCDSIFPTKNEWKRHTAAQHLQLGFYRCDLGGCSPSHPNKITITKGHNDFNRKDLFTQHCRRMHWDECKGLQKSKIKGKEWSTWANKEKYIFESFMETVRGRCWVNRRGPPSQSECTVCGQTFVDDGDDGDGDQGAKAWEKMMDHVGKHYEMGQHDKRPKQDVGLRDWCGQNKMGQWIDGKYWLVGCEPEEQQGKGVATTRRCLGRRLHPSLRNSLPATDNMQTAQCRTPTDGRRDNYEDSTDHETVGHDPNSSNDNDGDDADGDDTDADGEIESCD